MRKNVSTLITIIVTVICMSAICILVSGCIATTDNIPEKDTPDEKTTPSANPFETDGTQADVKVNATFSAGPIAKSFIYTGTPLEVDYEIENTGPPNEIGIMVYIDGIIQRYRTDESDDERYIHSRKYKENDKAIVKMYIDPTVGVKNQTLVMGMMAILNPSYKPDSSSTVDYGHNFDCSTATTFPIEYQADSRQEKRMSAQDVNIQDIPQKMKDAYVAGDLDFESERFVLGGLIGMDFFDEPELQVIKDSDCQFVVSGVGGNGGAYRLSLFRDNEPYVFPDGSLYIDFPIKNGKVTSTDINMDVSHMNVGDAVTIYALAVPVLNKADDYSIFSTQTERYLFVKE